MDQRSGDGWISGWSKIFVFYQRNSMTRFWGIRCEDRFSTEQNHPSFSLQKKNQSGGTKGPDAGPFPSRKTDCLPDLRVLPGHWSQRFCRELCRPIYNCSSKWWYSGIRYKVGRNFIINDANTIWWHLGRIGQIKNTRAWETQDRIGILQYGDSPEESWTSLSQIEDNGEKKYRAEIARQTPWSRIREQNCVNKEVWEIVGSGKPTGSILKETIAVSGTISTSVQNQHSRIRLQILSCSRMREMRREPEVPEAEARVEECLDCRARTTSEELAPVHSVKSGILQNACCASPKMMQIWRKVLVCAPPGWRTAQQDV